MTKSNQEIWDRLYEQGFSNAYPFDVVVQFLIRHVRQHGRGAKVLELGCGTGGNLWFAAREGFDTYGIDDSAAAIERAAQTLAGHGVKADLRHGDVANLPYADSFFDLIFDRGTLTHLGDAAAITSVLKHVATKLKVDGRILFTPYSDRATSFNPDSYKGSAVLPLDGLGYENAGHIGYFGKGDVMQMARIAGLTVESLTHHSAEEAKGDALFIRAYWAVICRKAG
jgi:SAM-dependent methyltransferase